MAERHVVERHARTGPAQRHRLGVIAQLVRHQQRFERFGKARQMLDHVDQRDREIARRMQHRETERAGEHHIAGRDRAAVPERDRPGEQADGERHRDQRVDDAQPLQIPEAALARGHLAVDGAVEAAVLAAEAAIGAHQRHVADDVDHLAVDGRGLVGEVVMQRAARAGHAEHGDDHDPADHTPA